MQDRRYVSLDGLEVRLRSCRDDRGLLTFAEERKDVPFALQRMFWITDVPPGAKRGGHAHSSCMEMVCCVNGHFRLVLDNGRDRREFILSSPTYAVIIPAGVWCSLEDFSEGSVVLVGASEAYSPDGYIKDYDGFVQWVERDGDENNIA